MSKTEKPTTDAVATDTTGASTEQLEASSTQTITEARMAVEAALYQGIDPSSTPLYSDYPNRESERFSTEDSPETYDLGKTEKGKTIQARKHPVFSGYVIELKEGGILPKEFHGRFTTINEAQKVVEVYLHSRK